MILFFIVTLVNWLRAIILSYFLFTSLNKSLEPFVAIHSDVWDSTKFPFVSKARYFVIFINECTKMTWVSLLNKKSDVGTIFQEFHRIVST